MRTITIPYEDGIKITLARATVADARVRRKLALALKDDETGESSVWLFYVTQLVDGETEGVKDKKITVAPDDKKVVKMFEDWIERTDEILVNAIGKAINDLRVMPNADDAQKKISALSSNGTSELVTQTQSQ